MFDKLERGLDLWLGDRYREELKIKPTRIGIFVKSPRNKKLIRMIYNCFSSGGAVVRPIYVALNHDHFMKYILSFSGLWRG